LKARVGTLQEKVEELRRAAKRQAAPFSRDRPKADRCPSGRKPGPAYGTKAHRMIPDRIDRVVDVPLPPCCPFCAGEVVLERVAEQYQQDIPRVQALNTRFGIQVGRCTSCGRRVQPRHPEQTSDALGAAAVQIGPRALALAAWCTKGLGLPVTKVAGLLERLGGLSITPGGLYQALGRTARAAEPTYDALVEGIKASPAVSPDETGWRVGGYRAWMWVFVGLRITVYRIAPGRGYEQAEAVLGAAFSGVLERDGWHSYRRFTSATHQTCLAHLVRRGHGMLEDARGGQVHVPLALKGILTDALALRDARDAGDADPGAVAEGLVELEARADALLDEGVAYPPNVRLLNHVENERPHLFPSCGCRGSRPRTGDPSRPCGRCAWCASTGAATPPGT